MTIDEAIANAKEKVKEIRENIIDGDNLEPYESYCNTMVAKSVEEHEQLAGWLEELKSSRQELNELRKYSYVQGHSDGYNNAIDDFAENIRTYYSLKQEMGYVATTYEDLINYIFELAEQLKAGESE